MSVFGGSWSVYGWYFVALCMFHWSEYFTTAATNPRTLTLDSFLLDHSRQYQIAALASLLEFTFEWFCFPGELIQLYSIKFNSTLLSNRKLYQRFYI
jgi:protein-S-isoprenylcysteine O-methyltransferase